MKERGAGKQNKVGWFNPYIGRTGGGSIDETGIAAVA